MYRILLVRVRQAFRYFVTANAKKKTSIDSPTADWLCQYSLRKPVTKLTGSPGFELLIPSFNRYNTSMFDDANECECFPPIIFPQARGDNEDFVTNTD